MTHVRSPSSQWTCDLFIDNHIQDLRAQCGRFVLGKRPVVDDLNTCKLIGHDAQTCINYLNTVAAQVTCVLAVATPPGAVATCTI